MLAAGALAGCAGGTSSETVGMVEATPGATGIAGRTDAGIALGLYSADFRPQANTGFAMTVTADSAGEFSFADLPPGPYQLLARRTSDGKAALLTELEVPSEAGRTVRSTLEPTGSLAGIVTDSLFASMGIVYIPGTPFFALGDSLMHFSLTGMPAGNYRVVKTWKQPLPCAPTATCGGLESRQDSAEVRIRSGENATW